MDDNPQVHELQGEGREAEGHQQFLWEEDQQPGGDWQVQAAVRHLGEGKVGDVLMIVL